MKKRHGASTPLLSTCVNNRCGNKDKNCILECLKYLSMFSNLYVCTSLNFFQSVEAKIAKPFHYCQSK